MLYLQSVDKSGVGVSVKSGKKALFVIDTLEIGGAEQSLLVNTSHFLKTDVVICHLYKGDALKEKFIESGSRVYSFNIQKRYGFISAYQQLKKVVAVEKPDVLVAYLTRSEIITRLVGHFCHIPVIGTFVTDLYAKTYNQHLSWKAKKLVQFFKFLNKLTSRLCIGFIANSQVIKEANAKRLSIPLHKIKVINRGRESFKFHCRDWSNINTTNGIKFVNVSRLYKAKGHKELIIGFKNFIESCSSGATLHIIGDGPMRAELTYIIHDHKLDDKVFLLGARNDVPVILSNYDCFVFTSFHEGFSGCLVEAMFAGLPILATNIPPNKEVVTHLKTGYLFDKESVEEVTKAMLWYKNNITAANALAKKAYQHARENFELDKIVNQFEEYLHQSIKEQH